MIIFVGLGRYILGEARFCQGKSAIFSAHVDPLAPVEELTAQRKRRFRSNYASLRGKFGLTYQVIYDILPQIFLALHGAYLIQESKSNTVGTKSTVGAEGDRKIPLLQGANDPFSFVGDELKLVEANLVRAIRSREQQLTDISGHLIYSGGKRVRPMVTLLAYAAFGGKRVADIVDIATAIELIHTATLLHDDIIDGADTRRGKASAYKKFGLKSTLVAGDFLFIKAFEFAGKFDETVVQWTADACTLLTEGEILQGHFNRNRSVTLDDYVEIVKRKTASLFHTGAKVGAYLAGANTALIDETERYGLHMGIAFQMVDDVLDVVGHPDLLGKPTGMDLRDGNPALPIILAMKNGDATVCDAFDCPTPTEAQVAAALNSIKNGPAIEEAKALAKRYAQEALKSIKKLPPSLYRNGLKTLVQLIIDRDF